jgi:hypothetical protein
VTLSLWEEQCQETFYLSFLYINEHRLESPDSQPAIVSNMASNSPRYSNNKLPALLPCGKSTFFFRLDEIWCMDGVGHVWWGSRSSGAEGWGYTIGSDPMGGNNKREIDSTGEGHTGKSDAAGLEGLHKYIRTSSSQNADELNLFHSS